MQNVEEGKGGNQIESFRILENNIKLKTGENSDLSVVLLPDFQIIILPLFHMRIYILPRSRKKVALENSNNAIYLSWTNPILRKQFEALQLYRPLLLCPLCPSPYILTLNVKKSGFYLVCNPRRNISPGCGLSLNPAMSWNLCQYIRHQAEKCGVIIGRKSLFEVGLWVHIFSLSNLTYFPYWLQV